MKNKPDKPIKKAIVKKSDSENIMNDSEILKQVDKEYQVAFEHQQPKIEENLTRLKLYNNQKRDKTAVGDPLLFTIMQTVLASLYADRLMAEFTGFEEGDTDVAQNLQDTAKYDFDAMQKGVIDYYWIWDALFFGRGLVKLHEFERVTQNIFYPVPELLDPMTFLRDPSATSVRGIGIKKTGAMRFGGMEVTIPKYMMTKEYGFNVKGDLTEELGKDSLVLQARQARDEAQGRGTRTNFQYVGSNAEIPVVEWYTVWEDKKVILWLANERKKIIKAEVLGKADKTDYPIVDRPMYPTSHDWDGTSIPDVVEDKQRQRAVMMNLSISMAKADLYPMYVYDPSRIKNKSDLMKFDYNKFVAVDGDGDVRGAVQPMNKATGRVDIAGFILDSLDMAAQKATATPELQQGVPTSEQKTLGELNMIAANSSNRYGLAARVFGWSEKEFWRQWYNLYKKHMGDKIDKKIVRISGSYGTQFRELTRDNLIPPVDPDIRVVSTELQESRNMKERILMQRYGQVVYSDPTSNKKYFARLLGKANGLDNDQLDVLFPPSVDELIAREENDALDQDKLVQVSPSDNDQEHLFVHRSANETPAKKAHIEAHKTAMMMKRQQPELFATGEVSQDNMTPQNSTQEINPAGLQGDLRAAQMSQSQEVAPTQPPVV